jgi:Binding-prot-dependent transport system membrane comp, N-term
MRGFFRRNRWWMARIGALPLQLLVFAVFVFLLVRAIPGDPVEIVTGRQYTPEVHAEIQHAMGLDGSLTEQLERYLLKILRLDFGDSLITDRSILGGGPRHVEVAVKDARHSSNGQYAMAMVERLRELRGEAVRPLYFLPRLAANIAPDFTTSTRGFYRSIPRLLTIRGVR